MIIVTEGCEKYALPLSPAASVVRIRTSLLTDIFLQQVAELPSDTIFIIPKNSLHRLLTGITIDVEANADIHVITSDKLAKNDVTQLINRFTNGPREISLVQVATYMGGRL